MPSVLVHILNEEPILCEVEELPAKTDTILVAKNPRKRDNKDLTYLVAGVDTVIWPIIRIAFIEVMPGEEGDQIIGFVRE